MSCEQLLIAPLWFMLRLIKLLSISLFVAGVASFAAYQIVFRLAWWQLEMSDHRADGQAGMGPFFGAAYAALMVAVLTFIFVFWRIRKGR